MRLFGSYCLAVAIGITCVIGGYCLYRWAGSPVMYLALNPALTSPDRVVVSFANAQRHNQPLDAANFEYFLYPSPTNTGIASVQIHVKPYTDNVAARLTREANAISLRPRESTDIIDVTPLLEQLPVGKWKLYAIFHPAPTYTGAVLWNGPLRSLAFNWERQ